MFLFVLYAVAIWYLAYRHRREWAGAAWLIAGMVGIASVGWVHYRLNVWTDGRIFFQVLQVLLYPYGVLVLSVGAFLALMPRPAEAVYACGECGYDLVGLEGEPIICPECGIADDRGGGGVGLAPGGCS